MAEENKDNTKNIPESGPAKHLPLSRDNQVAWWQPAIFIFLKFSAWIFVPVVIALFLGRWLDKKFSTEPFLFLATIGFSFFVSMFGIVKGSAQEFKKIEEEEKMKKGIK
jgi:hypothetical protein